MSLTIFELKEQINKEKPITNTHKEIDELKNRIMARKSTQRSSRENISVDSRKNFVNCNENINETDPQARFNLYTFQDDNTEDKENTKFQ